jgi:hypothetical protein
MKKTFLASTVFLGVAAAALLARPIPVACADASAVSPIFGVGIPDGYREWAVVAPSHRTDNKDELRTIVANPIAYKALKEGTLPLPDGSIIAKLAWLREPMDEFPGAFRPGDSPRLEFMVKDSKKFKATGGWGFARFVNGKPVGEDVHRSCFPCHETHVKERDFVFTKFAK